MDELVMGIYIHIPFCIKKCNYCDFLSFPADEEVKKIYVDAVINEIKAYGRLYKIRFLSKPKISSVFFGGGTPSVLDGKYIGNIMSAIYDSFEVMDNAEITIEANPGTLNLLKLSDYKKAGINRLSIGLQSACNDELKILGRIHTYEAFKESYRDARKTGFDNINIDIMSAIPGQSIDSYKDTLNKLLSFEPEHISAYSLIIEEGTLFFDIYENYKPDCGFAPLPDEDTDREMYYMTDEMFSLKGYNRYEISNYSKKGFECRHNLAYWERVPYLGTGLGSSSFIGNKRFKNIYDLKSYINICSTLSDDELTQSCDVFIEKLIETDELVTVSKANAMSEYMYLGLRKTDGISQKDFFDKFGVNLQDTFEIALKKHSKSGLININGDKISLTKKGIDISNFVLSDFIL